MWWRICWKSPGVIEATVYLFIWSFSLVYFLFSVEFGLFVCVCEFMFSVPLNINCVMLQSSLKVLTSTVRLFTSFIDSPNLHTFKAGKYVLVKHLKETDGGNCLFCSFWYWSLTFDLWRWKQTDSTERSRWIHRLQAKRYRSFLSIQVCVLVFISVDFMFL